MSLINKKHVRAFALEVSRTQRSGKFIRVSKRFLEEADCQMKIWIKKAVQNTPSKGKTI